MGAFWFDPQETSTLALVRIGLALVSLLWALSLVPNATDFFGPGGIVGREHDGWLGGLLAEAPLDRAGLLVLMVLAVASVSSPSATEPVSRRLWSSWACCACNRETPGFSTPETSCYGRSPST